MKPLEWICQNIVAYGAKAHDNKIYTCELKAEKCRYCSVENKIINRKLKRYYICDKKGIIEKVFSPKLAFI